MKKNYKRELRASEKDSQEFKDYLLKEYQNIAEAHFRTIETISSFFRYYLIIMAIPITIYSTIIGLSPEIGAFIAPLTFLSSLVALVIGLVGICVFLYIVNLRMDALLYARNVNGIRKYFYDKAPIDLASKLKTRVLPQAPSLPSYFEPFYFLPVVTAFTIFNGVYVLSGLAIVSIPLLDFLKLTTPIEIFDKVTNIPIWVILLTVGFMFLHFVAYWFVSYRREHSYLKSYILGVDIDGVLNEHRDHFCTLLDCFVGKQLCPEDITSIPIHDDPTLGVSRTDEKCVFNNPRYWIEMPSATSAPYTFDKLRNIFGLKIHLFTHRPWPSKEIRESKDYKTWIDESIQMYKKSQLFVPRNVHKLQGKKRIQKLLESMIIKYYRLRMSVNFWRLGLGPIDLITKCWLKSKGFQYDELTIEKGNEDISDPQGKFKNRFYISRKKKIRFFVEDVDEKASKLAYICDVVFLIKHPYNQKTALPKNVLVVSSWEEIYRWIRKVS